MVEHVRIARLAMAVSIGVLLAAAAPASAQYFGQNKVQYKDLDFKVLKTAHFDVYYYPQERTGAEIAARMAERWNARYEQLFAHKLHGRQPLILYGSHPAFEQTNAIPGDLGEGTGGVTEPVRRRIVLPLGGPLADTDHVIGHELVHAFQFDMTTGPNSPPGQNGAERLPLWFIEGMAEYCSLGPVDPNTAMWMRDAVLQDKLPAISDLDSPKYFPYRWGQAFWAYVGGRYGDDAIRRMLAIAAAAGDTDAAIQKVTGLKTKELSKEWQDAMRSMYQPILAQTMPPNEIGRKVIAGNTSQLGADLNVGPSISPDGRWIAFLSSRSVFSIDLFLADATNGKVVRQLTSTATDPHFSSIQFIYSAGAWDAASQRIAIATVTSGHAALAIYRAANGSKEREIAIPDVDEIFNPTWSPDGQKIAFTGMAQGLTDLYLYDLTASKLHRLTSDAYADLQPAWSPDGSRIAFATDRFSTDLGTLHVGDYQLALLDPQSGSISRVRTFTSGKSINPQWTPDGRDLLFIADPDGIPNLYRIELSSGTVDELTKVGTGLSGITASSPALSVSAKTGQAAFSVYDSGGYDVYLIDAAEHATAPMRLTANAAALPPPTRRDDEVAQLLANSTLGLPPIQEPYTVADYRPSLSLEGVGQPTVAVGATPFGAAIGGGVALQFGDMLGNQTLATAVELDSGIGTGFSLKNTAAQAMYYNQAHRWNWGVLGSQVPYLSGAFASGVGTLNDQPVEVDQSIIYRQTEQSAAGVAAYPFNRAARVEFQGGLTRLSFDQIVETTTYSLDTGGLLDDSTSTTSLAAPLTLANTSAAFVYDTANYGATSPVVGQRYRLEAAPSFGSINFTSLLGDYRKYFMPAPFYTIATRVLHFGRYGSGGEDARLFPLFIGYPDLVRGYDVGTFDTTDCTPTATSSCPQFDRLLGSRVLVGNVEFRFPLLRPFGESRAMYGPLPVEVAFFADGGVAWNRGETPAIFGGGRQGVASAGVTLRVNLFGFAVGEFDFSHPFQRPNHGFVFQFNLSPGF